MEEKASHPSTSAEIFRALSAAAKPRRRMALMRLKEACDEVGTKRPIKLTAIEEYIKTAFGPDVGPRAQSMSNERTLPLGMYHYVEARERERKMGAKTSRANGRRVGTRSLSDRIEAITDMDLRADVRDILDRSIASEKHLARARTLFRTLDPGFDFDTFLEGGDQQRRGGSTFDPALLGFLDRLVGILTDDEALSACGLALIDGRVRRKTGTGDELIPPKVLAGVSALRDELRGSARTAE